MDDVAHIAQRRLQSYFVRRSTHGDAALSFAVLFELFPAATKLLCYGLPFSRFLAAAFAEFVRGKAYRERLRARSSLDELILLDVVVSEELARMVDECRKLLDESETRWTIEAVLPGPDSLDAPRISFVNLDLAASTPGGGVE